MLNRQQNRASATVRAKNVIIPKEREVAGDIGEIVESIREFGLLQPIGVRRLYGGQPVLVWGCKRHKALLTIDPEAEIEIIDLGEITDDEAAIAEIEENLRRHTYSAEDRAKQTARSVELRAKIIEARKQEVSRTVVPETAKAGRPLETRAEAVRQEAAAQGVTPRAINKQIAAATKPKPQLRKPVATGKVEKRPCTSWEALKAAYEGASNATQRKLLEYAAHEMGRAAWSKFIAELPDMEIPREAMQ